MKMKKEKLIRKKVSSHEEWLEERRKGIGGSDAAAILNCNKYSSPYEVWLDKKGKLPPKEPTLAMKVGTYCEQLVAKCFEEETGKKVRKRNEILRNSKYPFAHANVDRWVVGENAGLECKTTSTFNLKRFKNSEFPEEYYIQCMHYMAVTGAEKYYLAVLIDNYRFEYFELERDQEFIDLLMQKEEEFWKHVKDDTPPPVDGTDATGKAQLIRFSDVNDDLIDLKCAEIIREYEDLSAQINALKKEKEKRAQIIKEELGEAQNGLTDSFKVSWKKYQTKRFDHKRYIKDHSEIDFSNYFNVKESRRLSIKKIKHE